MKYLQVGSNKARNAALAQVGVHTRRTCRRASLTPRNNTKLHARRGVDDGAARVTLARVLSTLGQTSAEHGRRDAPAAVVGVASGAADDGDVDLEEVDRQRLAAGAGGAPAGDGEACAGSGVGTRSGELGVADCGAGGDGGGELHDGDVVVVGAGGVRGVDLDGGDPDEGSTGRTALEGVLVRSWMRW
jgi:hypothetical protein